MIEIVGKNVFDGQDLLGPTKIVVDGETVSSVEPCPPGSSSANQAAFVGPGLIDAHVHVTGYREGTPGGSPFEPQKSFLRICALAGVTTLRDLGNTIETIAYCREWSAGVSGPRIISAGPLLDIPPLTWPFSRIVRDKEAADRTVDHLAAEGVDWIKAYRNVPPDVLEHIVAAADRHGLPTAVDLGKTTGLEAAELGVRSYEHAVNLLGDVGGEWKEGMPTGLAGAAYAWGDAAVDGPAADKLVAAFKANGTWLCPTLLVARKWSVLEEMVGSPHLSWSALVMPYHRQLMRMQNPIGMRIGKRMMARYMPVADLGGSQRRQVLEGLDRIARLTIRMHEGGVNIVAGTDAPNPSVAPGFGLHEELVEMHRAGIPALDVLRSATGNASLLLRRPDLGVIRPGAKADLLCLQADPTADMGALSAIAGVMIRGKWVDRDGLAERLRTALEEQP